MGSGAASGQWPPIQTSAQTGEQSCQPTFAKFSECLEKAPKMLVPYDLWVGVPISHLEIVLCCLLFAL